MTMDRTPEPGTRPGRIAAGPVDGSARSWGVPSSYSSLSEPDNRRYGAGVNPQRIQLQAVLGKFIDPVSFTPYDCVSAFLR